MTRDYHINGESLVAVKGTVNSSIATLQELGLAEGPIVVTLDFKHSDINVDAWGGVEGAPPEIQWMGAEAYVTMDLIHYDRDILETCLQLTMGGDSNAVGQFNRAGTRMGRNFARFGTGNNFISVNVTSPVEGRPWRFFFCYITSGYEYQLSTKRTAARVQWRCVPYITDPYNGGLGAYRYQLWDHSLDT